MSILGTFWTISEPILGYPVPRRLQRQLRRTDRRRRSKLPIVDVLGDRAVGRLQIAVRASGPRLFVFRGQFNGTLPSQLASERFVSAARDLEGLRFLSP